MESKVRRRHRMPFGAELTATGEVRFRLWAPAARRVEVLLADEPVQALAMEALPGGWFALSTDAARTGSRYRFRIDGQHEVADPASRWNPQGVHGASAVVDPAAYPWDDADWQAPPWHGAVIYELHVGTFSAAGTYAGVIAHLPHLVRLGVTAIELMPLAAFPGQRGWGYDGVLPYAPHAAYGTPAELKTLVAVAHGHGLAVLLDVVYNHFGPEGNYLHLYAPQFFNAARTTPWGAAINFDGPDSRPVRDFFIHNALYWLEEYHCDGLRLDAVHAIHDDSEPHIVNELAHAARSGPGRERTLYLTIENFDNAAPLPRRPGGPDDLRRAVERRPAPLPARAAHRGGPGLLRRLREAAGAAAVPRAGAGLRLPGRGLGMHRRPARAAERAPAADRVRELPAEPRPGRQPRAGRAAHHAGARGRGAARGEHAAAAGARAAAASSWARSGQRASRSRGSATSNRSWRAR